MQFSLYIISTPIGNLKDITQRAIEILGEVDYVLCEDTRVSSKLLQSLGLKVKFIVYNDHNASEIIPNVLNLISEKNAVFALISDAGTPLVSDPGYKLVNACIKNNIKYTVIPGACSVISALTLSGLPSDKFSFIGFADVKKFEEFENVNSTLIFFESPNRILKTLQTMKAYFKNRLIAVVREITKVYEEVLRGDIDFLIDHFSRNSPKGEFVILVAPPIQDDNEKINSLKPLINNLLDKFSKKDLSDLLSKCFKVSKNSLYNFLLNYKGEKDD